MIPRKRLSSLKKTGCKKISRLEKKVNLALALSAKDRDQTMSFVVIEALNTWNNFLRSLYLSLTIEARSTKGKKIIATPPIPSFNAAIGIAINANSRFPRNPPTSGTWNRRDEPSWHNLTMFRNACQALNCSYIIDIDTALSIGTRAYRDLPTIRNYYAHRNESTVQNVKNLAYYYGIPRSLSPTEILYSYPLGNPYRPLILDLLSDLSLSMELLCEGI
ncbi:hypothetical protein ACAW74_18215 [Fibrella sp. WM1]|uniref:hypothetical protein n=1 Tax=Fibrella musci TaxID=3242485 RepID=UPI0035222535